MRERERGEKRRTKIFIFIARIHIQKPIYARTFSAPVLSIFWKEKKERARVGENCEEAKKRGFSFSIG
jgi:hypothetical protein